MYRHQGQKKRYRRSIIIKRVRYMYDMIWKGH